MNRNLDYRGSERDRGEERRNSLEQSRRRSLSPLQFRRRGIVGLFWFNRANFLIESPIVDARRDSTRRPHPQEPKDEKKPVVKERPNYGLSGLLAKGTRFIHIINQVLLITPSCVLKCRY
jgi:hypothetical protein